MNRKITVPVTDWTVAGKSIPIGYEGEMNRQTIIFDFDEELTAAAYTIEIQGYTKGFRFLHKDGNRLWLIVDKYLTQPDLVGAVDLQIKAYVEGEMIAKSNVFSGRVYESINAETEIPDTEISAFDRALLDYNDKLQQAITAAEEASSAKDEAISAKDSAKVSSDSASASATDAQLSAQLADTYQTMANNAAVNSIENAGKAEDAADSAERLAELARSAMTIAQTSAEDAVRARDAAVQAKTDTVGYADSASASALAAKNADAGATMAANTAYASQRDAESASQSAQRSAQSASQSAQEAVASASSAAGSASAATNSAATAEAKASEASVSATQAENAKTSTENLLSDAREGLQAKLDKPVDVPFVGSLARVKGVNPDGTFVMEWVEDKQDKIESDLAWEAERVDDAYDILDGVGYDKVEMSGEAYSVDIPEKAVGKAEVTEFGGKTVVWNQMWGREVRTEAGVTFTKIDGIYSVQKRTVKNNGIFSALQINSHKYYVIFTARKINPEESNVALRLTLGYSLEAKLSTEFQTFEAIITGTSGRTAIYFYSPSGIECDYECTDPIVVDLTNMFGSGNEPTDVNDPRIKWVEQYAADHPEYNEGELVSAMVEAVASTKPDETVIESHQIPDAVKSLPGYGWSAGTAKNYIYKYNGRWMYRQEVKKAYTRVEINRNVSEEHTISFYFSLMSGLIATKLGVISSFGIGKSWDEVSNIDAECTWQFSTTSFGAKINRSRLNEVSTSAITKWISDTGFELYYSLADPIITDITDLIPERFGELDVEAGGSVSFESDARMGVPYKMGVLERRSAVRDLLINGESVVDENGDGVVPLAGENVVGVSGTAMGFGIGITNKTLTLLTADNNRIDDRAGFRKSRYWGCIDPSNLPYAVKSAMTAPISVTDPAWKETEKLSAQRRLGVEGEYELIIDTTVPSDTTHFDVIIPKNEYRHMLIELIQPANIEYASNIYNYECSMRLFDATSTVFGKFDFGRDKTYRLITRITIDIVGDRTRVLYALALNTISNRLTVTDAYPVNMFGPFSMDYLESFRLTVSGESRYLHAGCEIKVFAR